MGTNHGELNCQSICKWLQFNDALTLLKARGCNNEDPPCSFSEAVLGYALPFVFKLTS